MFREKILHTRALGAMRQRVQRRVALANGDDLLLRNPRQDFAKPPNPALVSQIHRSPAIKPKPLQRRGVESARPALLPTRIDDLQQIAAMLAAKPVCQRSLAAANTAQL